jgi:hypothetical protein
MEPSLDRKLGEPRGQRSRAYRHVHIIGEGSFEASELLYRRCPVSVGD